MPKTLDIAAAVAAALVLVVGIGFGRFAFTGLYPLMVAEADLTLGGGSVAASANYAGYLVGALVLGFLPALSSQFIAVLGMAATVVLLAVLGFALPEWLIVLVRGLAGVSSALAMVGASQWLMRDRQQAGGSPVLFSGVGTGIFVSAELIAVSDWQGMTSNAVWLVLAAGAAVASLLAVVLMRRPPSATSHQAPPASGLPMAPPLPAARLILVYGLAGFGYIITATYLPLVVRSALGSINPVHFWAAFGLGAIPSCFLWHALHVKWGTRWSLMANLLVQAIGVVLPALFASPVAYLASALLVGGTFMGTVTIVMPAARRLAAGASFNMLAIITAAYGVGQIIGPVAANGLYTATGSFSASLLLAAAMLMVGVLACIGGQRQQPGQP